MESANNPAKVFKMAEIWAQIDPALLEPDYYEESCASGQDIDLAQRIKSSVLVLISSQYSPGKKSLRERYGRFALMAAAVAIIIGISWLFADLFPWPETSPTRAMTKPADPTHQATKLNPTQATQTAQTTRATLAPTMANGIYVPAFQIPENPRDIEDMLGVVVIKGRIFIQSKTAIDYDQAILLKGEYLGRGKGNLDEWSKQADYATELASSTDFPFFTVNGYDPDFRVMGLLIQIGYPSRAFIYDCVNGINVTNGRDVFGKLNLQNLDDHNFFEKDAFVIRSFVLALDQAAPILRKDLKVDTGSAGNRLWIELTLQDHCRTSILLIKGGYIHYGTTEVWFKMQDLALFDAMWTLYAHQ